jgi:3-oxoacyl-[acyl-carrier protein] reductase
MDLGLTGKRALVGGGGAGIGHGIATALAAEGATVALLGRTRDRVTQAASTLGGHAIITDLGTDDGPASAVFEAIDAMGGLDLLVANTGGPPPGGALDNSPEEWEAAFRSLVLAPKVLIEAVLPGMRERGWGRIVNVSSTSIQEPIQGLTLSNANRLAALGLLETLADEVAGDGITVNTVATGMFATDRLADAQGSLAGAEEAARQRVPAKRLGSPEEYGDLVAFLSSERAAYLTGAVIPLDGGLLRSV